MWRCGQFKRKKIDSWSYSGQIVTPMASCRCGSLMNINPSCYSHNNQSVMACTNPENRGWMVGWEISRISLLSSLLFTLPTFCLVLHSLSMFFNYKHFSKYATNHYKNSYSSILVYKTIYWSTRPAPQSRPVVITISTHGVFTSVCPSGRFKISKKISKISSESNDHFWLDCDTHVL